VSGLSPSFGATTGELGLVPAQDGRPAHVRKVLSPSAGNVHGIGPGIGLDEGECHYWARERHFYRSVATGECPADGPDLPLRPPRPLAVEDRPDGSVVLRLEYVAEAAGGQEPGDYRRLAFHLGVFNGHHLRFPHPEWPTWLSRGWLRWWFGSTAPVTVAALRRLAPSARTALAEVVDPDSALTRATALWRSRTQLLSALAKAPLTLCHLDANRRNLLLTPSGRTVALDWSYVGIEALGSDAAQLLASSAARLLIPGAAIAEYRAAILDGYCEGLRAAGVSAELCALVPSWFDLVVCLRWGVTHLFWARHLADPARLAVLEERWWGRPYQEAASDLAGFDRYLAALEPDALGGRRP
jgi:hypothetical protein